MDEAEAKPPHAGERLTREDVLRLIEEHGGPELLDLRQADLREVDLSRLDLHGANLMSANLQGTHLWQTNLRGASLLGADLQAAEVSLANLQGATLYRANLEGAALSHANLQQADLRYAKLQGARLRAAHLRDTNLEGAKWGDYVLGDEIRGNFGGAASVYRALKQWHTDAGMYDIAGEFFFREMEARRKLAQKERRIPDLLALNAFRLLYGYGERPLLVAAWAAAVILGFALGHWLVGTVAGGLWDALYYSAVSFTALGYGWAAEPQGWAGKFLGVGESLLGVFMMALFLVTFTRKMTR